MSRGIVGIVGVIIWVISVINLLSKSPPSSALNPKP